MICDKSMMYTAASIRDDEIDRELCEGSATTASVRIPATQTWPQKFIGRNLLETLYKYIWCRFCDMSSWEFTKA